MRRGLVLVLVAVALTGCHDQWGGSTWGSGNASGDEETAQSNVRQVIPAIEAYYADNGTYQGATLAELRTVYDAALPDVVIVTADQMTYCVESTVGDASFFKAGPALEILPGRCGDPGPDPTPPPPSFHTDAEAAVLEVIPAIEGFHADSGTYEGLDANTTIFGMSLSGVRIYVRKGGAAYCVEAPPHAPSAHFVGPAGPLAQGPC